MSLKFKVLRWLFSPLVGAIREEHLKKWGNDVKCSKCQEWFSITGIRYKHEIEATTFGYTLHCGQCSGVTHFNTMIAPLPIHCDAEGTPL